jgi:hypothetical protein
LRLAVGVAFRPVARRLKLQEVFGIATRVNAASYVDRGGLDERLRYLLETDRHIAIHGDSKQGKSWLRTHVLGRDDSLVVQCQIESTPESLFQQALGTLGVHAELSVTKSNTLQGTLDLTGNVELGKLLAKASAELSAGGELERATERELQPVGQTAADLSWVARILKASRRRLVLEDFHYLGEEQRTRIAFILKALGDYGVYVMIVGVWPDDHLLTYYNGDLDGRVEDVRLEWSDDELDEVLQRGGRALNVEFASAIRQPLIADAFGNVGLVQRLAEHVCLAERIYSTGKRRTVDVGQSLSRARSDVAEDMHQRYRAFGDNFVRGMKRMSEGLEVYKHLLRQFTTADAQELQAGIDSKELLSRIKASGGEAIRQSDLTQALDRVDRLQVKIGVHPPVLTYNRRGRRLFLADRSFLFYRANGTPRWPWDNDADLEDALNALGDLALFDPDALDKD